MNFTIGLDYCESKKKNQSENNHISEILSLILNVFVKNAPNLWTEFLGENFLSKPAWFGTNLIYLLSRSIFKVCKMHWTKLFPKYDAQSMNGPNGIVNT